MSQLNPLNDLSRAYLDHVAQVNQQNESDDVKRWQEGENDLQKQIRISSEIIASGGAPTATMEEEKKAAKDYDGDGKVESGKDEYFGSKDKAIKKAMGKRVKEGHEMGNVEAGTEKNCGCGQDPCITYGKQSMGKKVKEDADNYVEAYVTELKKTTLGSYVSKASKNLSDRRFDQGRSEKATYEPDADDDKEEKKLGQREKGISRAATKLSKEETELDEANKAERIGDKYRDRKLADPRLQRGKRASKKDRMTARATADVGQRNRNRFDKRYGGDGSRKLSKFGSDFQVDTQSKDGLRSTSSDHAQKQRRSEHEKRRGVKTKGVKEGRFSDWRDDLSNLIEVAPMTDVEAAKEVKEKKVNNKVVINPKMSEAVAQIGGELIAEKEVDVKDTRRTVDAIRAYDRSKDASRDATYDTDKGNKKKGDIEKKYAKKERGEIDKDDPNWKNKKYHTGMHGEAYSSMASDKKKKKNHDCASKVKHEEYGIGFCIKGQHTILEDGTVGHYDVEFEEYIVENCPVEELEILVSEMHMHKEMKEGVVSKEVKELQKAGKTLKDTPVVKADKTDTPNYKGNKFGVKEDKDWIQGAVKRPGAFTRKAKAAGQSVQQFAKTVDDNPGKYSTRTKKQANLAQTFASMKKEDVQELFYTLIAE
jgi:hypothetical protein